MEKVTDTEKIIKLGKYKPKRQFLNFVTGLKGKIRLLSTEAFIKGEKFSMMLEGAKFKVTILDEGTIDFEEVDTNLSNPDMIQRFIDDIDSTEVTGYVQKFVVSNLEFFDEEGKNCYLEVEHKKPIDKMFSIFEEKSEISTSGLSILDALFQDTEDTKQEEVSKPKKEKKSQKKESKKFLEEAFEKMNQEKIKELKERIEVKESEIFKNRIELDRSESKDVKLKDELKVLNSRLKSLMPKEESNGYNFFVSQLNKTGIELDESLKKVVSQISPVLNLKEDAVLDMLTGGFYTITLEKKDGTTKIDKDALNTLTSIDIDATFESVSENQFNYRGKLTWHQIVDSLICKGFEQDSDFDKKCGSNSYESKDENEQ